MTDRLQHNLIRVTEDIAAACVRSNRSPSEVTLVAVTKYAELDWVRRLMTLGVRDLGESRPQQLEDRAKTLSSDAETIDCQHQIRWHMIGHLQRNKVRSVVSQAAGCQK